ncbi:MAG: hypothetical protein WCH99_05865 [Verrucomicrobiota bacterium]
MIEIDVQGFRPVRWFALTTIWMGLSLTSMAADAPTTTETFDYAEPKLITGTVYETGSEQKKVLYTFRRTATRTNDTVHAERQFARPDGFVAAVENIVYKSGRLVYFQMKEFQANVSGTIDITPDPKNPAQQNICIGYDDGLTPQKGDFKKNLQPDTVIDDTLYPFMLAHWDSLMKGDSVKFHFVTLEWKRTFMFRLVKVGETTMHEHTHIKIKMEPTNLLVAPMVNPLFFMMEKDGDHHLVSYVGRTTPRVKKGKFWKYLDAETVFDWK